MIKHGPSHKQNAKPGRRSPSRYLYSPGSIFTRIKFSYTPDHAKAIKQILKRSPETGLEGTLSIICQFGGMLKARKPERVLRRNAIAEMKSIEATADKLKNQIDRMYLINQSCFETAWRRVDRNNIYSVKDFLDDICGAACEAPGFYPFIAGKKDESLHWAVRELIRIWHTHTGQRASIHSLVKEVPGTRHVRQQYTAGPFVGFLDKALTPLFEYIKSNPDQFPGCQSFVRELPSIPNIAKSVVAELARKDKKIGIFNPPKTP